MFRSRKDHVLGLMRISERMYIPQLGVLFVLLTVIISTGCGNGVLASSPQNQSLHLSANFPSGMADQAYNTVISVNGGTAPYRFYVKSGSMPDGLTLNSTTGSVSGTPMTEGTYTFEIAAIDLSYLNQGSQTFVIDVKPRKAHIKVSLSPLSATVGSSKKQQFTATVTGTSNTAVTWTASPGSIDASGLYTAPSVTAQTSATVSATSVADTSRKANATLTITGTNSNTLPLTITTTSLAQGQQGSPYSAALTATGGTLPYSWALATGNPPSGVSLSSTGQFSGLPSAAGTYSFAVSVTDATSQSAQQNFTISIVAGGNFDGPAELPRVTVPTAMSDTPAPGNTISVPAGGNLQAALNNANCGDTIALQAGASFAGLFTLPAKSCDNNHWIIIRTSAPDSSLPAEGSRLSPCYAGVASLPSRPSFNCSSVNNVLAQVIFGGVGAGPFILASGANHYRLLGLEITRKPGTGFVGVLVFTQANPADHIIVDRSWLHGTAQDETETGISFLGMTNAAVIDSFLTDFHCTSRVGSCTDSKAIGGGLGSLPGGPYKIANNFLEAAGENILLGGGAATTSPADIEIRGNHFFKPLIWQLGRPGYVGGQDGYPFVVKNLFELKNAQRVLFEGNILENNWGGFTQWGHAILLTPKNQYSLKLNTSVCPLCQVTDVTIRYSTVSHVGAGISIATALSTDGGQALAGARYSIHDITVDDINAVEYQGHGNLFIVMNGWTQNVLNSVQINHVTGFSDPAHRVLSLLDLTTNPKMWGFVVTNSILGLGGQTIASAGGGTTNCAYSYIPITSLNLCFSTYTFTSNAIINSSLASKPADWPTGNLFAATPANVQFTNFNNGNGGDYQLLPSSPYHNAGSDGKDLGADLGALQAAIAGVY